MKLLHIALLTGALGVSACANLPFIGGGLDTGNKRAVAFCNTFESTLGKLTIINTAGQLSESQAVRIDIAVALIEPYCAPDSLMSAPKEPTEVLLDALSILITLQTD